MISGKKGWSAIPWLLGAVILSFGTAVLLVLAPLVTCDRCAGICDRCQGAGVVRVHQEPERLARCPDCGGRGSSVLSLRKHSKLRTCSTCDGEGIPSFRPTDDTICGACSGAGYFLPGPGEPHPAPEPCPRCAGKHRLSVLRSQLP